MTAPDLPNWMWVPGRQSEVNDDLMAVWLEAALQDRRDIKATIHKMVQHLSAGRECVVGATPALTSNPVDDGQADDPVIKPAATDPKVTALEAWIKQHGIHAQDCDTVTRQDEYDLDFDMETICTCGLTAILVSLTSPAARCTTETE